MKMINGYKAFFLAGFIIIVADGMTDVGVSAQELDSAKKAVLTGIEYTTSLSSFHLASNAHIELNGKLINGTFNLYSDIDISQGDSPNDLVMSSVSSSDLDDVIVYGHYENGIYTEDDGITSSKIKESPEDIMETVVTMTDLVKETASKIDDITMSETEQGTVYSYELREDLAEGYLDSVLETLNIQELEGADVDVTQALLVSIIDADGYLVTQDLHLDGKIRKAIFAIPAHADMTAQFSGFEKK